MSDAILLFEKPPPKSIDVTSTGDVFHKAELLEGSTVVSVYPFHTHHRRKGAPNEEEAHHLAVPGRMTTAIMFSLTLTMLV